MTAKACENLDIDLSKITSQFSHEISLRLKDAFHRS